MKVEFLGTAGYHPNANRHTSCTYLPEVTPTSGFVLDAVAEIIESERLYQW